MKKRKLEICQMLTLSTAHITPETDTLLEGEAESNSNIHLPVCHKKGEYGYFIYVSPKITPEKDEGYKAAVSGPRRPNRRRTADI